MTEYDDAFEDWLADCGNLEYDREDWPDEIIEKILNGEVTGDSFEDNADYNHAAEVYMYHYRNLLDKRSTTVATEFLFHYARQNFEFCRLITNLLEEKLKQKGGDRLSEDELLATRRRYEDPSIAHLPSHERRRIAGKPDNIEPDAVRYRLKLSEPLARLHEIRHQAFIAELHQSYLDRLSHPDEEEEGGPFASLFNRQK
ncbi:hypothetical protein VW35_16440 [Devosia soli]|uniref:Uncharacterized protein n=1 Tax=Devosia soli TaxID=361041 RepID=A0A0F5L3F5_9HYPH|nr:hypothetical protein [Devosia soli]KKB76898.1 hypothetical protein VW35_16440 [Devosia soli]